ncbi:MAG: C1 family peptidase [Eubacterium sp.]|nr:C1 family peptidase [Eubacterium sp.]
MKLKQIISAATVASMLPMSLGTTAFAGDSSSSVITAAQAVITENEGLVNIDFGNDDSAVLDNYTPAYSKARTASNASSYNTDLDNLQYVTEPKNQEPLGLCWDFSSMSCFETMLMKQIGLSSPDLSELHAALAMSNKFLEDDTYGYVGRDATDGGNPIIFDMYTTRAEDTDNNKFTGPVDESCMEYTVDTDKIAAVTAEEMAVDASEGCFPGSFSFIDLSSLTSLTDTQIASRNSIIKEFVDKYGSAVITIYAGTSFETSDEVFKEANGYKLFYESSYLTANHGVAVVGYDDSFPASNFTAADGLDTPPIDGAFIVKNSWGTDWGNGGYFYMSYASYLSEIYAFGDAMTRNTYDYIYDYTPNTACGGASNMTSEGVYYGCFANHFTKQSSYTEKVNKISVFVLSADTTLELYVDADDSDGTDDTDETSGYFNNLQPVEAEASLTGSYTVNEDGSITVPYAGNYVFELTEPVEITGGGFTAAVYAESENGYPVAFEISNTLEGSLYVYHKYSGESYLANSASGPFGEIAEINFGGMTGYEFDFVVRAYTEEDTVSVTINDTDTYTVNSGTDLSTVLSDAGISETVYKETAENSYKPADTSGELTEDITLYTGSAIYAPAIEMNNYQTSDDGEAIRFVGEITDEFDDAVEKVIALGFVYSKDGDTDETKVECGELYQSLEDYTAPDNTYLFKSDELTAADYIVTAYVSYVITGGTDAVTVYTEEKTISTTLASND